MKRVTSAGRAHHPLLRWLPRRCFVCKRVYLPALWGDAVITVSAHTPAYADHDVHGHPGCCAREVLT